MNHVGLTVGDVDAAVRWYGDVFGLHIALTVDDFDITLRRICDHGGRARTKVYDVHGETYICYCEDPWGNVLEIVSRPYAELSTATTY